MVMYRNLHNQSNQVTSRGCSRAYIVCVLWHTWEYVRSLYVQKLPVCYPFPEDAVKQWLVQAKEHCNEDMFLQCFGGTYFMSDDPTTYWSLPSHFFTW